MRKLTFTKKVEGKIYISVVRGINLLIKEIIRRKHSSSIK